MLKVQYSYNRYPNGTGAFMEGGGNAVSMTNRLSIDDACAVNAHFTHQLSGLGFGKMTKETMKLMVNPVGTIIQLQNQMQEPVDVYEFPMEVLRIPCGRSISVRSKWDFSNMIDTPNGRCGRASVSDLKCSFTPEAGAIYVIHHSWEGKTGFLDLHRQVFDGAGGHTLVPVEKSTDE